MRLRFAALMMIAASTAADAQPAKDFIELQQGAQIVVRTTRPFSSIAVADPEVTDALPRSDRSMVIVGKKVGASDVIVFSDADPIYHVTVSVSQPRITGKIYNHNQKKLDEYKAYQCNPVCVRTDDKFEQKEVIVLGGSGAPTAIGGTSTINVVTPPAR